MDLIILNDGLYSLVPVTKAMLEHIKLFTEVDCFELCDIIRIAILLCIGAFAPIMIHHIVYKLWDVSVLRAAEITFVLCIPVAYWMASKINERWHDDRE